MNRHPKANNLHPRPHITQPADPSYRIIALTQGQVTLVDTADYEYLMQWHWYAWWSKNGQCFYAVRTGTAEEGEYKRRRYLHRDLLGFPDGMDVDHENGNTLDNRRHNLRVATTSQNGCNRGAPSNSKTGFKGVRWHKRDGVWQAYIKIDQRLRHLGTFKDPESAARAYDAAARELHGEFAKLNFPD